MAYGLGTWHLAPPADHVCWRPKPSAASQGTLFEVYAVPGFCGQFFPTVKQPAVSEAPAQQNGRLSLVEQIADRTKLGDH